MANTRKRKAETGSVLYGFFLALYIVALGYVIFWALGKLWTFAVEYQNSQSEPVMEAYIDGLRETIWDDSIAQTVATMPHEFQTDEECGQVIREILHDDLSYTRAPGSTGADTQVYNLLCGKNLFGKVTLKQDKSGADQLEFAEKYGLYPWRVDKEEFYFDGLYTSTRVTVPFNYSVEINGKRLSEDYVVEDGIHFDVLEDYYQDFPELPTKKTYQADHIFGQVTPVIYDEFGQEYTIDTQQNDSQYIRPVDEETRGRLENFAWDFANRYLAFSTGASDMNELFNALKKVVVSGSDLENRMKGAVEGYVGYQHNSNYRFGSAWLNDVLPLGNGNYVMYISATCSAQQPQGYVESQRNLKLMVVDSGSAIRALSVEDYEPGD